MENSTPFSLETTWECHATRNIILGKNFFLSLFLSDTVFSVLFDLVDQSTSSISDPVRSARRVVARNRLQTLPEIFLSRGEVIALEPLAIPKQICASRLLSGAKTTRLLE